MWCTVRKFVCFLLSPVVPVAMTSCSTGIESTKTIKMNKEEIRLLAKTPEQNLASEIKGTQLKEWHKGKEFMAMSERAQYLFDPSFAAVSDEDSIGGKILKFEGLDRLETPGLKEVCEILFSDGENILKYNTDRSVSEAIEIIDSSKLPMLADMDLVRDWHKRLVGKKLWTRSNLWYDERGNRKEGLKFVEVEVLDVMPTQGDFPMKIVIDRDGDVSYMFMNYTSDLADSRNFAALFYFNDPKTKYPAITDENWQLIQKGKVGLGMTKDECRLAIGTPDDLASGHSTSQTMDIWQYSNGTYLMFTDGLLTSFRQ